MSESFMKDIVYDLIASKLKNKELEDRLAYIEKQNEELTKQNIELKSDVNKWRSQVVAYINDYRNIYNIENKKDDEENKNIQLKENVNTVIVNNNNVEDNTVEDSVVDNCVVDNIKDRKEYMKEYMRNKRKKNKEEFKKVVVNKK